MPWTTANIPTLSGRTAIVTGANSGLGFQTARQLARRGAEVVLACRDSKRGEEAAARIRALTPEARITVSELDLASLASVRRFAGDFLGTRSRLDILVNNAGVMAIPHRYTDDGFEMQFGVNHLGHFALTGMLLPALLASPDARVVSVSSVAARIGRILFDDLQSERRYNSWVAYAQAKLANLLFIFELDRRLRERSLPLIAAVAHPGYANTNLQAAGPRMSGNTTMLKLTTLANKVMAQSGAQGALPQLYAATAPDVHGGDYFGPDRLMHTRGYPVRVKAPKAAHDVQVARRLWEVSEQLTGVKYDAVRSGVGKDSRAAQGLSDPR